jgi:predicted XRE-type DNA-binding protein
MIQVRRILEGRKLTQAAGAKLFRVTQPRISDLVRDRIELFSIDGLVNVLAHAGVRVSLVVKASRRVEWRFGASHRRYGLGHQR